jgi:hypothetical protein
VIIAIVRSSIALSLVLVLVFKVARYAGRLVTPSITLSGQPPDLKVLDRPMHPH